MQVLKNISVKPYNTFAIDSVAKTFVIIESVDELVQFAQKHDDFLILGGGSNILFVKEVVDIPVVKLDFKGLQVIKQNAAENQQFNGSKLDKDYIKVQAGYNWDDFVNWSLKHGYYGLENLAKIPGSVGGAVVQNIGAYGAEISDFIYSVTFFDKKLGKIRTLQKEDCKYSYRSSKFKGNDRYVVLEAILLLKKYDPKTYAPNTKHRQIADFVKEASRRKKKVTPQDVYNFIANLRASKLPDVKKYPNAGSFFLNPVITKEHFESLKAKYPDMPGFEVDEKHMKVPAGWLIDKAGLKGYRLPNTDAGVSEQHALVLVNYGKAKGKDILDLANFIKKRVFTAYNIQLKEEVFIC